MDDLMKMDDVKVERRGCLPRKEQENKSRPKQYANQFFIIQSNQTNLLSTAPGVDTIALLNSSIL
jgi:hypothetical protein